MAEFKRSRLAQKQNEQITRKTILLGLLTVALFILMIVFGLPFLVKFSVFLGEAKKGAEKEVEEKVLPPLPPRLVLPFEATNSARISIEGFASPNTEVDLLKNDVSLGRKPVDEEGEFSYDNVILDDGVNTFSAVDISEQGGSSEMSKAVTVVYDDQVPELTMINPSEEELEVDYDDFDIVGKSEKGVSVLVNNRVAIVDDDGMFKLKYQLSSGKNEIEVVVRDLAGNETKKKITINYVL